MKKTIILIPIILFSLLTWGQTTKDSFVGVWGYEVNPSDDGEKNFSYLELRKDGKGIIGLAHEFNNEKMLVKMMTSEINYWKTKDDVLEVNYSLMGGPPKSDFWIIGQVEDNYFSATIYFPEYDRKSGTVTFKKMDKIEKTK